MEAVAAGFMALVAVAAVLAAAIGALAGALAWRAGYGLVPAGLCAAAVYLLVTPAALGLSWLGLYWGMPLLILSLLVAWLTAREAAARASAGATWATLAALGAALAAGGVYLLLLRLDVWFPVWASLAADAILILLALRVRPATQTQ